MIIFMKIYDFDLYFKDFGQILTIFNVFRLILKVYDRPIINRLANCKLTS